MKKIIILTDTNVGGRGGAETHLWQLMRSIDPSQVKVDVIYFDADAADKYLKRERPPGANYHRVPLGRIYSYAGIKHLARIYSIMKSDQYDCAVSFFESSDIVNACLASVCGIRVRISNRRDTGFLNSFKMRLVYRLINRFFSHFIAVSEAVKQSLIEQGVEAEQIHVIHNAVDLENFSETGRSDVRDKLGLTPTDLVFGMVANLNPVKNHRSVIAALKKLHLSGQCAHLILAGDGTLRDEIMQQVADSGLSEYVHFLGSRTDINNVLAAFDVFILASFTEGLSNALLEAMAAGKAIIASSVGGNVEVVQNGENGLLVAPKVDDLAAAMERLYLSSDLRSVLGEKARLRVRDHFSLEKMLDRYMGIFNRSDDVTRVTKTSISQL